MSKDEYVTVAQVVAEARWLSSKMRPLLDSLDAVLDKAEALGTDEIARLEEEVHAGEPSAEQG